MSSEIDQKQLLELANNYSNYHTTTKELTLKKKDVEDKIKNILEVNNIKNFSFSNKKISFSSTVRKSMPKINDIFEIFHKVLIENLIPENDKIMEKVYEEVEKTKKESVVRILRIQSKNDE